MTSSVPLTRGRGTLNEGTDISIGIIYQDFQRSKKVKTPGVTDEG